MCHPINIIAESFDVLSLFGKLVLGDEHWEANFFMFRALHLLPDDFIDVQHDSPAIGGPYVHTLYWVALIREIRLLSYFVVPFTEIF